MTSKLHKSDWLRLIAEFNSLNITKPEFCRVRNIKLDNFNYHYYAARAKEKTAAIIPVSISKPKTDECTTIVFGNGLKMLIPSAIMSSQDFLDILFKEVGHDVTL